MWGGPPRAREARQIFATGSRGEPLLLDKIEFHGVTLGQNGLKRRMIVRAGSGSCRQHREK